MSLRKSVKPLGKAVNVWNPSSPYSDGTEEDDHSKHVLELLKEQSRQCYEMQQLCLAVEALVEWRKFEDALSPLPTEELK
jgi:hypothetical protein